MTAEHIEVDVHLHGDELGEALRRDVVAGIGAHPPTLPPKWFYDDRGSELFDQITRLDAYYPTRREREIRTREADAIARASGADTLVELGSGTSDKTRLLLDAFVATDQLKRFVLSVLQRQLDAKVTPDGWSHVALWNPEAPRSAQSSGGTASPLSSPPPVSSSSTSGRTRPTTSGCRWR